MQRKNPALDARISDGISDLDDVIARSIANLEQCIDAQDPYPEQANLTTTTTTISTQAHKGLQRFGLLPAVSAKRNIAAVEHSPFTTQEMELLQEYLEHLSEHSTNATEKHTVGSLIDSVISYEFMLDPVRLRTDGRTYDRSTLLKMIAERQNISPINRIPFNAYDFEPDLDKISLLGELLKDAKQLLEERSRLVSAI